MPLVDFNLQEALEQLSEPETFPIQDELDVSQSSASEINAVLNSIVDAVADSSDAITSQQTFDMVASLLKHGSTLQPAALLKLLDCLQSGLSAELDATVADAHPSDHAGYRSHKLALEMYAFTLRFFILSAEKSTTSVGPSSPVKKGRGRGGKAASTATARSKKGKEAKPWEWADSVAPTLGLMGTVLHRLKTERIWQTTQERDGFVGCFTKSANQVAESDVYMKAADIKQNVYKIFCIAVRNHGQSFSVQTTIMQNLQYAEHLADPMAELVALLAKEFDYAQLGEEVLREISGKTSYDKIDTKGPKSFSKFLVRLAELSPRLVLKQISLLQKHLDSESYPMRNAIIEVIALLIKELSNTSAENADEAVRQVGEEREQRALHAKQIAAFFDLLFERFLDVSAFVRSKVVTVFIKLMDLPTKFPAERLRLAKLATRSLEDKSSIVRKNCIALLSKMIMTHPYGIMHGGDLNAEDWQERYENILKEIEPLDRAMKEAAGAIAGQSQAEAEEDGDEDEDEDDDEDEDVDDEEEPEDSVDEDGSSPVKVKKEPREKSLKKKRKHKKKPSNEDPASNPDLAGLSHEEMVGRIDHDQLTKLQLMKRYYTDALLFIKQLEDSVPLIADLLNSTTKSEVLEAMEFCTIAERYKLAEAEVGVKAMLHLIWAKDNSSIGEDGKELKSVRSKLLECYKTLYFEPDPALEPKANVNMITRNMIERTFNATLAELISFEELMGIMMSDGNVHENVIEKLWAIYSTPKGISKAQRQGAILILGMLAAPKPEVAAEHLDLLLKIGLGPLGKRDLVLAKYTCQAIRRIGGSEKKVKGSLADKSIRLTMDNSLFNCLKDVLERPTESKEWFGMAEQAINTIYVLGDQPDALCSELLRNMAKRVFAPTAAPAMDADETIPDSQEIPPPVDPASDTQASPTPSAGTPTPAQFGDAFQLAQLIFVAGHVAIKHLIHLELLEREYKRRKAESEKQGNKAVADELDQVVGSVEDDIADVIHLTKEKELLYGPDSLLAIYAPMTIAIVKNPSIYRNHTLRVSAALSMSKFMCVSAQFCEDHLMMLFKLSETNTDPVVRSNIAIALGDIAVAFSTIMDDNSDRLYQGLNDKDQTVKKNTLMVLTHLILNGMIKVKGQLGEMAKCLEDDDRRIQDLAKLFFSELASKDNAIYNNLPDIVSSLSAGSDPVDEATFEGTMRFIFKFIDKEKQAEAIVEKLCQRFRIATETRQWRDIAFCLSLLPFKSDKSMKKLEEALPLYQDKLVEPKVFARMNEILVKARSNKGKADAPDYKEFETALNEARSKGEEDKEIGKKVEKKKARAARKKN